MKSRKYRRTIGAARVRVCAHVSLQLCFLFLSRATEGCNTACVSSYVALYFHGSTAEIAFHDVDIAIELSPTHGTSRCAGY